MINWEAIPAERKPVYSDLPPLFKWTNRIVLGGAWGWGAVTGTQVLLNPPTTIVTNQPGWMSVVWGLLLLIGSSGAALGVLFGRNRIEEVAAWFAGAGTVAYVITLWTFVFAGETTRSTQASYMSMLLMFILSRALTTAAHNYRLRKVATVALPQV